MPGADATIRFDTRIDPRGFDGGIGNIDNKTNGLKNTFNKLRDVLNRVFHPKLIEETTSAIIKQQDVIDVLQSKLNDIADIEAKTPIVNQLEADLAKSENQLDKFAKKIRDIEGTMETLARAGSKPSEELQREYELLNESAMVAGEKAEDLRQKLSQINVPKQPKESVEELNSKLEIAKLKLEEMQARATKSTKTTTSGMNGITKSVEKFINKIKRMVMMVFVFSVIRKAIRGFRDYLGLALKDNEVFMQSFGEFKANMLTAIQPLVNILVPAITKLMQILSIASAYIVQFASLLSGQSVKAMQESSKAMDKLGANAKKTSKEINKTTASFDDLITLQTQSGSEDEQTGIPGIYADIEEPTELTQHIADIFAEILAIGGLVLLTLGVVLAFTGANIPLGLGLMVAGAAMIYAALVPMWGSLSQNVQDTIALIFAVVSVAFLVLGCILAFSGVAIPLGIALIVLGAAGIWAESTLMWDSLSESMKGTILAISAIVSVALLVLGCILAFTGVGIPLGIALIALGAVGLAASVSLSDALPEDLRKTISKILLIVGAALLALGVILCCFGIIPIGIALIVAGVGSLVAGFLMNKDGIINTVKDVLAKIGKFFSNCWEGIKYGAAMAWWGIQTGVISMVNFVIDVINTMVKGILSPFNLIIDGLNLIPGVSIKKLEFAIQKIALPAKPQMPALAKGAVLPGGAPFMAWVNDQPRGQTNIEAPLATIEEAVDKVFNRRVAEITGQDSAYIAKIEGNMAGFFRWLNIELIKEKNRASTFGGE